MTAAMTTDASLSPDAEHARTRLDYLAGYRVIRRLGQTRHSTVYLACPSSTDDTEVVIIKQYSPTSVTKAYRAMEVAALCGGNDYLMAPRDISQHGGDTCVVFPRASGGSVQELLATGTRLSAGQVVTLLVPVLRGLIALHEAGFAHGRLDASRVLLAGNGQPLVSGASGTTRLSGLEPTERARAVAADYEDFVRLALRAIGDQPVPDALSPLLTVPTRPSELIPWPAQIEQGLFAWSVPAPLVLERRRDKAVTPQDSIVEAVRRSAARRCGDNTATRPGHDPQAEAVGTGPGGVVAGALTRMRRLIDTVRTGAHGRRRLLWYAAAVCGCVVAVACVALPPSQADEAEDAPGAATPQGTTGEPRVGGDASHPVASAQEVPATTEGSSNEAVKEEYGEAMDAITSDEPVAAARLLLDRRQDCFDERSLSCLDFVDQAGSAALARDQSQLARAHAGGTKGAGALPSGDVTLVDRSGNSALVALATGESDKEQPASLLLIRSEAGWLIRDIFVAGSG